MAKCAKGRKVNRPNKKKIREAIENMSQRPDPEKSKKPKVSHGPGLSCLRHSAARRLTLLWAGAEVSGGVPGSRGHCTHYLFSLRCRDYFDDPRHRTFQEIFKAKRAVEKKLRHLARLVERPVCRALARVSMLDDQGWRGVPLA